VAHKSLDFMPWNPPASLNPLMSIKKQREAPINSSMNWIDYIVLLIPKTLTNHFGILSFRASARLVDSMA
jgi:hypothetical protein